MTNTAVTEQSKQLAEALGLSNLNSAPRLVKVSLNVGIPSTTKDPKVAETIKATLRRISGQTPIATLAKKSISSFKTRQGMVVGMAVTLRGRRMYDFVQKFIHITLPRTRDFWGISPKHIDKQGNLSIGIKEHLAFPEIRSDEVEHLHGLQVTFVSSTRDTAKALALYKIMGIPFKED